MAGLESAAVECCSPEARLCCCEPYEKDGCCGPQSSSCGCLGERERSERRETVQLAFNEFIGSDGLRRATDGHRLKR